MKAAGNVSNWPAKVEGPEIKMAKDFAAKLSPTLSLLMQISVQFCEKTHLDVKL